MYRITLKMLRGDRAKFLGLLFGIAFTAFLVTFALSYFAGFMTRGFALVSENPSADVWVMDPAVHSTEMTIAMSETVLQQIRSVKGVAYAVPISLHDIDARFANGRFQRVQLIGVDDATLAGTPLPPDAGSVTLLRVPDAVFADAGGTEGKLRSPRYEKDYWPHDGAHLDAPLRNLRAGDELQLNDRRALVTAVTHTLPRFPPRPLLYTTLSNVKRILPSESRYITFVMVSAQPGVAPQALAKRITDTTGFRARTTEQFKADTVRWYLVNSEDVGDMTAMLILAMTVGFGVTGIMLYMFTYENLKQYAVLKAIGASERMLLAMIFVQASASALLGALIGIGACALTGWGIELSGLDYPFRLMWFGPLTGILGVLAVSLTAAAVSVRPVLKLEPGVVFSEH